MNLQPIIIHKNCGGNVVTKSCQWDDMFNGCDECDQHEHCDGWETESMHPDHPYHNNRQCMGCYRMSSEIMYTEEIDGKCLDDNSHTTNCGNWYCHSDCGRK